MSRQVIVLNNFIAVSQAIIVQRRADVQLFQAGSRIVIELSYLAFRLCDLLYVYHSDAAENLMIPGFGHSMGARILWDKLARYAVGMGGVGVLIAILLIFFYLVYIVLPLFTSAQANIMASYNLPDAKAGKTLLLGIEEQNEVAVRFTDQGKAIFFSLATGETVSGPHNLLPAGASVTSFNSGRPASGLAAFGLANGKAKVVKFSYKLEYAGSERNIIPQLSYPLGEKPITIDRRGHAIAQLAVQSIEDKSTIASITDDGRLMLTVIQKEESMLEDSGGTVEQHSYPLPAVEAPVKILLEPQQEFVYVLDASGFISVIEIKDPASARFVARVKVAGEGEKITTLDFLAGGISLLVGTSTGNLSQWFPQRTGAVPNILARVRDFKTDKVSVSAFSAEERRKGFAAGVEDGKLSIFHSTAGRRLLTIPVSHQLLKIIKFSPRADRIIAEDAKHKIFVLRINNEHPEVSWSVLWDKIWYEDYPEPSYNWQSSSASNDFEPKFSLTPLLFGTLKAAFYAMMIAIPLAIMGAIYSAYFMAPAMRRLVKPTIEIMEALPTVILGFLAGLWLAPLVEANLPGVFMISILLPLGVLLFAFAWHNLPASIRQYVPDGWTALLLIPVLAFLVWLAMALSLPVEEFLFNGNMRVWMTRNLGVDFDQRNSIVVGIAMGVAVIPTIYTITEDAIFSVPKHLTNGSLALGATMWQTLVRVVLLTASPGIFSAVMIGMGRAVGETMIVLMATGNTPVMDFSIFQGMRTLAANVAVEMPEAEVSSTHYRILFMAALVLFLFTFVLNAGAEIIRQRLRKKYSSL